MSACDACLRRTELIAALAPRLDIEWRRRSAPAGVLALPDEDLLALDPTGCAERGYAAFSAAGARDRAERAGLGADLPLRRRLPDAAARARGRRRRCCTWPADPRRSRPRPPWRSSARAAAPRTGSRSPARSGASLAAAGVPVVSGMALGVDSAAHVGALDAPDPPAPVAVLAGGADVPVPARRGGASTRGSSSAGASSPSCRPGSPRSAGASSPATGSSRRSRR